MIKKNKNGIKILTDRPIPLITPNPTIIEVKKRKIVCQKTKLKGEEERFKKYSEEYWDGFSKLWGKILKT